MSTPPPPTFLQDLHAVAAGPLVHQLAHSLQPLLPRRHRLPLQIELAYFALARSTGSANSLDGTLANHHIWRHLVDVNNQATTAHGTATAGRYLPSPTADTVRTTRNILADAIGTVRHILTEHAVPAAIAIGLLPESGGSLTRPSPLRTVYGDGTIIRPIYGPGQRTRVDHSIARHTRHDGTHWGNNIVTAYVRGPKRHARIILGVDRVTTPGREAQTALDLFTSIHGHAGHRIQAIAYDGAMRGTHHNQLMRSLGVIVVNRVHGAARPRDGKTAPRIVPLTSRQHETPNGPCSHTLVTIDGSICEAIIDAAGNQHYTEALPRTQIRRHHSRSRGYRFTIGSIIDCPAVAEPLTVWVAVHDHADHLRLLPPTDPHFPTIYGLRNDSESANHHYKNSLPHRRAAMLGWRRQLLDAIAWAILTNSRAIALHRPDLLPEPVTPPRLTTPVVDLAEDTLSAPPPTIRRWAAWRARTLAIALDRTRDRQRDPTP